MVGRFQPSALRGMAIDTGYKRCSLPTLSRDSVIDNCYMPELQLSNLRKRQRTEPRALQSYGTWHPQLKKQKLKYPPTESQLLSAF